MKKFILIIGIIGLCNVYASSVFDDFLHNSSNKDKENRQTKCQECVDKCLHLMPSPSGDLQSSEFTACYKKCMGTLD